MRTRNLVLISIIAFILLLGACGCSGYNSLVDKDVKVKTAWANVESEYQRRSDLIPNLVSTVKGSANFEQETLTGVINARSKATGITVDANNLSPEKIAEFQKAQNELRGALSRLLVVAEQYPDLKSTQAFRDLQTQLEGTENRIKTSRKDFNDAVGDYNSSRRKFPMIIISNLIGFPEKGFFEAEDGAEKAPTVDFTK